MTSGPSDKSRGVALALAFLLGIFGGHRFYAGKPGTGILMALTVGGAGLWYVYDLILVASGGFHRGPAAARMTSVANRSRSSVSHHGVRAGVSSFGLMS
ncbi:MAG: TM2 domain-containing protein, partial [Gemmatimonadales bacterium]